MRNTQVLSIFVSNRRFLFGILLNVGKTLTSRFGYSSIMPKRRAQQNNVVINGKLYKRSQFVPNPTPDHQKIDNSEIAGCLNTEHKDPAAQTDWEDACAEVFSSEDWQEYVDSKHPALAEAYSYLSSNEWHTDRTLGYFLEDYGVVKEDSDKAIGLHPSYDGNHAVTSIQCLEDTESWHEDACVRLEREYGRVMTARIDVYKIGYDDYERMMKDLQSCVKSLSLSDSEDPCNVWAGYREAIGDGSSEEWHEEAEEILEDYIRRNKDAVVAGWVMFGAEENFRAKNPALVAAAKEYAKTSAMLVAQKQRTSVDLLSNSGISIDLTSALDGPMPVTPEERQQFLEHSEQSKMGLKLQANELVHAYKQAKQAGYQPVGWKAAVAEGFADQIKDNKKAPWGFLAAKHRSLVARKG